MWEDLKKDWAFKDFHFRDLRKKEYRHVFLLLYWPFFVVAFFLVGAIAQEKDYAVIHCGLDDMIPFCEYFAVFYVFWYALVFGSLIYTLLYDPKSFSKLSLFIFITQLIAMTIYILYPSRQDLRPEAFVRDNFLTRLMAFIYSFDTSTGVCPSLHVAYSMGILSVGLKNKELKPVWKVLLAFVVVMICLATAFVKQHSMVDVFAALPVSLVAELFVYWDDYWKPRLCARKRA